MSAKAQRRIRRHWAVFTVDVWSGNKRLGPYRVEEGLFVRAFKDKGAAVRYMRRLQACHGNVYTIVHVCGMLPWRRGNWEGKSPNYITGRGW
jgi:hypothetical protein